MSEAKTSPGTLSSAASDAVLRPYVGYNMKRAFLFIQEDLSRCLLPMGLRKVTFAALAVIATNPGITQTQLAQTLGIERSGVVGLADELEGLGLISRNKVDGNRRAYALRATQLGEKRFRAAEAGVRAHENRLLAHFTDLERDTLLQLLRKIEKEPAT